jgi:hypothetical protein
MPDLSTIPRAKRGVFGIFRLARRALHVSFQSSDGKDVEAAGTTDWLQDRTEGTDWIDEDIGRWLDHGTQQFP